MLSQEIFRAYDIRGIVDETLTPETVYVIAKAIGTLALRKGQSSVIIARDGRLSGPRLSEALQQGLLTTGCNVINIGALPTPLLYFATHHLSTQSGVMLTGSHNPANYNGLKMVIAGETLAEQTIQMLYEIAATEKFAVGKGQVQTIDVVQDYINRIVGDIRLSKPLRIIVDAGNGIAGKIAPLLYRRLGCEVVELFCEIDGHFPNHHPDPSVPKNLDDLRQAVLAHHADVGLAFDGDGDRLGVITNRGEIIWPDRQLMLYAEDVLIRNPKATIIFDVKCTKHLPPVIAKAGGNPLMWKTGHSLIKRHMKEIGALLGGEMSGHMFFKERWYGFDDALYTGARLLEIISTRSLSISDVFKQYPDSVNTPELKIAVTPSQRQQVIEGLRQSHAFHAANISTIDGIRVDFPNSWGLVRGSNTTPHLIVRFEADSEEGLQSIQQLFRHELLQLDKNLALPF